ncbi:MAG: M20/M25/M40 family metallo-hydrolase [Hyphomicrobiaceae bacterium]
MTLSLDVRPTIVCTLPNSARVLALGKAISRPSAGVKIDFGQGSADVAPSDPELMARLTRSAEAAGIATMPLASPASHDTATFTVAGVPSCMLFVRNANGSHNPHEAMEIADFLDASAVLSTWLIEAALAE